MISLTLPEIRRLLVHLILQHAAHPAARVWAWSRWHRRRQYKARVSHYRRRGYPPQLPLQY